MKRFFTVLMGVGLCGSLFFSADLKAQDSFPKPDYDQLSAFLKLTTEALYTYTPDHYNGLGVKSCVEERIFDLFYKNWEENVVGTKRSQKWEMSKLRPDVFMSDNGECIEVIIEGRVTIKDTAVSPKESSKEAVLATSVHRVPISSENSYGFVLDVYGNIATDQEQMRADWTDYPKVRIK